MNKDITKPEFLEPDENHDIYYGNLVFIKKRLTDWTESHPEWKQFRILVVLSLVFGFAIIVSTMLFINKKYGGEHQNYLHFSIWIAAALIYIAVKSIYKIAKPPFSKIYNARFEASDNELIYIFQRGMRVCRYLIADDNIESIIYDEKASVIYISGNAKLSVFERKGSLPDETVKEAFLLVPFDKYDAQDLLAPYGELVKYADMPLRSLYEKRKADLNKNMLNI